MGIRSSKKIVEQKERKTAAAKPPRSPRPSASKGAAGEGQKYSQTGAPWWKTYLPG